MSYVREQIVTKDNRRKELCKLICRTLKKGTLTKEGVIGGINFPAEHEHHNDADSHKWSPSIGYFGTVVVDEPTQKVDYDPDSPEVLEAWVDASESPTRIPLEYGQEFIPSEDGGGEHCGEQGFVISLFEDEEGDNDIISIGVGDNESVWWEKDVSSSSLERELKKIRLLLPILGYVLLEETFHSAEPE